jgi:hypothetical protein
MRVNLTEAEARGLMMLALQAAGDIRQFAGRPAIAANGRLGAGLDRAAAKWSELAGKIDQQIDAAAS